MNNFEKNTEDKDYKRYKHICYAELAIKAAVSFGLGILVSYLLSRT